MQQLIVPVMYASRSGLVGFLEGWSLNARARPMEVISWQRDSVIWKLELVCELRELRAMARCSRAPVANYLVGSISPSQTTISPRPCIGLGKVSCAGVVCRCRVSLEALPIMLVSYDCLQQFRGTTSWNCRVSFSRRGGISRDALWTGLRPVLNAH